jgi:membrane fusion protein (multidrug efflux system)
MKSSFAYGSICAACILSLAGCEAARSQGPPQKPPPEVAVREAHAQSVPITRELVGRLAATRIAQVRARVAGIVLERAYTEGTDVKRGQVLFKIDPAPLQAALHAEQAALAKTQADATNAALIARRYSELVGKRLISQQDLDSARATERTSAAAVKEAQANVEKARLDLGYATVTSPIAGRAGRAQVTEGALVGQGEATELTTVEQIDPLYVNFSQSVAELELLRPGADARRSAAAAPDHPTRVEVILPGGSPYAHPGTLDFADAAVDPGTGTLSLRALLPNPEHRLLPGMFVHLRLTAGRREHAFQLPQAALARDGEGAYVMVVDSGGKVAQRRVRIHDMTRDEWVVSGELGDGERVIVSGLQKVQPGASVKVVPWTGDRQSGEQEASGPGSTRHVPKDKAGSATQADRS